MWKIVEQYSLAWRASDNMGVIHLKLADGKLASISPDSVVELAALGQILREEKPVWYHTETGDLSTGWEPTGEIEFYPSSS